MKIIIKVLSVFLMCLVFAPLLLACQGDKNPSDTSATTTEPEQDTSAHVTPPLKLISDGKTEYVIVRSESNETTPETTAAVALNNAIKAACGSYSKITTDWERNPVKEYEICIGKLTRSGEYYNIDTDSLENDEFIVKACDTRLVMIGKTSYGTKMAVEWFIENYLSASDGSVTELSLPSDFSYIGKFVQPQNIRIMTQNLLATDTEYPDLIASSDTWAARIKVDLSKHTIAARQPRVLSIISTYRPDSMGVQECSALWRSYFNAKLKTIGYSYIGASKNPKIGIIYNSNTLKPIANASFWLTEQPETLKISTEWGAASDGLTERLGMYVVFEVIATGERYIHFNTHLDTAKNSIIQTKQTEVLLDYIKTVSEKYDGIPVVLTGDFNYDSSSSAYKTLLSTTLGDTKQLCAQSSGGGSFNKFIGKDYASLPIDQIVATADGFEFSEYRVIYDTFDGYFVSDHYAVIADISIKK